MSANSTSRAAQSIEISISEYFFIKWIEAISSGPAATP